MEFELDENKARINFQKRGVRFETAVLVFQDEDRLTFPDELHSN